MGKEKASYATTKQMKLFFDAIICIKQDDLYQMGGFVYQTSCKVSSRLRSKASFSLSVVL